MILAEAIRMEWLFWGWILFIIFTYLGYPVSLVVLGKFRNKTVNKSPIHPFVTLIITAYNEEKRIKEKLTNTLNLDYPKEKLEIIVSSDGSTDFTNDIVKEYEKDGIQLLTSQKRRGKEYAQKEAILRSKGNVLVFSDVATRLDKKGLKQIVSNFADSSVGCVSSEDRIIKFDDKVAGEGMYVRYEMWLRRLESTINSLVGLSGSFFAARKSVCGDFATDMQSDFRTLLNSVREGLRGVTDPKAIGYYPDISDEKKEFERKVRTVLRGITVFFKNLELLNPFKYGLFAYQLLCHKLLRWLVPLFLISALICNIFLAVNSAGYLVILALQLIFYLIAILAWLKKISAESTLTKVPMYFLVVNLAIAMAWIKYIKGQRLVMWTPSER
jgi:glycosyltransferase involved in cell wall biosynthesis